MASLLRGIIYRIYVDEVEQEEEIVRKEQEYIGYTRINLSDRLKQLEWDYYQWLKDEREGEGKKRYRKLFDIIREQDYNTEVLEVFEVESMKDLRKKHKEWIEKREKEVGTRRVINKKTDNDD